jgi:ATP-dependent RNA helicase RhlE
MTFNQLGIIDPILKALDRQGYSTPTPIQQKAIPILLKKRDLLGCAQTGTGKTAAFAIPIIQHLHQSRPSGQQPRKIRTLVVTPTRELATQIGESFRDYGYFTDLRTTIIFGGVKQGAQVQALRRGTDILVATPGRLLDLMNQGYISLKDIAYFVLDEADQMLDMGFIHDIRKLLVKLPDQRQSLFFSATMPPPIVELSHRILGNPEKVTIKPEQTTAERIDQSVYFVSKQGKPKLLVHLLQTTDDMASVLVFSRTKHGADKIVRVLQKAGIQAGAIHGNKSQGARERVLGNFKKGDTNVLVATDIASRGIDLDDLSHVINYDLPNVPETYVHRIGRTGRASASGVAMSFCDMEEQAYLKDIQKLIRQDIPVNAGHPFMDEQPVETLIPSGQRVQMAQPVGQRPGNGRNRRWQGRRRHS